MLFLHVIVFYFTFVADISLAIHYLLTRTRDIHLSLVHKKQSIMNGNQESFEEKITSLNNTADTTAEFDQQDINNNKVMAILAYFGILVLVPILGAKESKFARFHANQGLVLCVCGCAVWLVVSILTSILAWRLYWLISIISFVLWVILLILAVIGIINAANGKAKQLPVIGNIKLLKV